MKQPTVCLNCRQTFDLAFTRAYPWCGQQADEHGAPVLYQAKNPDRRGGKRAGAGAPQGNLNALKHGQRSKQLDQAIERLASDPELKPLLAFFAKFSARPHSIKLERSSYAVNH